VIECFIDRTRASLTGAENLDEVKRVLHERINAIVPGAPVTAVYLEDFVVQ
jgi:flagellar basal body-associated protein FliL